LPILDVESELRRRWNNQSKGKQIEGAMPNAIGKLTEDERRRVREWLESSNARPDICPVCEGTQCELDDYVVEAPARVDPTRMGWAMDLVAIVCKGCAFTRFFDARLMGIIPAWKSR
jgi:hypothetical protein